MSHALTTLRIAAALLITGLAWTALPVDTLSRAMSADGIAKPETPEVSFAYESDRASYEMVHLAFAEAGLDLPTFSVLFHDDTEACAGNWGLHVRTSDGRTTIHVCFTDERPMMHEMTRARTLLHEVAHAWVDQNVSADGLERFMSMRGLTAWDTGEWRMQGAEHAAEIILWGIQDEFKISPLIPNRSDDQLAEAFELLTSS